MVTPQRLELIRRTQVAEEVEHTWREKTKKHEAEIEEYRSATSRLRYELSFLKASYLITSTDLRVGHLMPVI